MADVAAHFKLKEVLGLGAGVGAQVLAQLAAEQPQVRAQQGSCGLGPKMPGRHLRQPQDTAAVLRSEWRRRVHQPAFLPESQQPACQPMSMHAAMTECPGHS